MTDNVKSAASRHSPDWGDFGDDDEGSELLKSSPSPENSQVPPVLAPHPPTPSASEPRKIIPQKRKLSAFDHLKDVSEQNQKARISVAQIKAQTKLERERLRLEADREKREHEFRLEEHRRQHELEMMKHTLEIERLRAQAHLGPGAPSSNPSSFNSSIDPAFFR